MEGVERWSQGELIAALRSSGGVDEELLRELEARVIEAETQNRELREAQGLLEESRARYVDLYDLAPVGLCTLDARGRVEAINRTGAALLGMDPATIAGRSLPSLVDPEAARALRAHLRRSVELQARVESEVTLTPRRGPAAVLQVVSVPWGPGGACLRVILSDFTGPVRARAALRWLAEAGARLAALRTEDEIVEAVPAVVVPHLADRAYLALDLPPGAARPRGLRAEAAMALPVALPGGGVGELFLSVAPPRRYDAEDLALAEALASRISAALDQARAHREAREAAARAEDERARAVLANRTKDVFLANVSHELRTPLTSILGWTAMLRSGRLSDAQRERALESVERSAQAQVQLVADLLDVARILGEKVRLRREVVDLARELEVALCAARPGADARGVRLGAALCQEALVEGDPDRIQQVVSNLIQNAVKFTPASGAVDVLLEVDDEHVRVRFRDTGVGIDPAALPRIFERFHQAEEGSARRFGGLGLGLAIVRHLVELHGGAVVAESEGVGRGALFTLTLPRYQGRRRSIHPSAAAHPGVSLRAPLRGLLVLVVEDDPDTRELFTAALIERGAAVTAASSASEAFAAVEALKPQVLVSDVGLPGEDGYGLLQRVRALPASRGGAVPALAVTAYAQTDDRDRALAAGFSGWIAKPVDLDELVSTVARLAAPSARN